MGSLGIWHLCQFVGTNGYLPSMSLAIVEKVLMNSLPGLLIIVNSMCSMLQRKNWTNRHLYCTCPHLEPFVWLMTTGLMVDWWLKWRSSPIQDFIAVEFVSFLGRMAAADSTPEPPGIIHLSDERQTGKSKENCKKRMDTSWRGAWRQSLSHKVCGDCEDKVQLLILPLKFVFMSHKELWFKIKNYGSWFTLWEWEK